MHIFLKYVAIVVIALSAFIYGLIRGTTHASLWRPCTECYRLANSEAITQQQHPAIVFFGDSIVQGWNLPKFFPGVTVLNRGISGQTTSQLILRFRQDVIQLHPTAVVILGGTNDLAGVTGEITDADIESNLQSIAELGSLHQIRVVFASILPADNYAQSSAFFRYRDPARILAVNNWMKGYCAQEHMLYLDFYGAIADERGMFRRDFSEDGLHPNSKGYKVMADLVNSTLGQIWNFRNGGGLRKTIWDSRDQLSVWLDVLCFATVLAIGALVGIWIAFKRWHARPPPRGCRRGVF